MAKKKLLIFIVTYNAERTISEVLDRIPRELFSRADLETSILVIDDSSKDRTLSESLTYQATHQDVPLTVYRNPTNLGYGGNQKVGYHFALTRGFDMVVLLHGDAQYAPEALPDLIQPILAGEADVVFGSRMLNPADALTGGMPTYKFWANRVLTKAQNALLGSTLSEWHSGYRIYSLRALAAVPFEKNSDDFDFDTDIIIQLHLAKQRIVELPIPTHYGEEVCHVNGMRYALQILRTSLQARLMCWGVFHNPKFDFVSDEEPYEAKFDIPSSHRSALETLKPEETLLILAPGRRSIVMPFRERVKTLYLAGRNLTARIKESGDGTLEVDLEAGGFLCHSFPPTSCSTIFALDILEHLKQPERLLCELRANPTTENARLVITAPNVGFFVTRLMLLFGYFNYGRRGILDRDHCRLFTFASLRELVEQNGYQVSVSLGIPAPYALALGRGFLADFLALINLGLLRVLPGLFAYQIFFEAIPRPSLNSLLEQAMKTVAEKLEN